MPASVRLVCAPAVAPAATSNRAAAGTPRLKRRCLIDQHYRNVITNRITQPASVTYQRLLAFAVLELAFAFWTNQNLQQLCTQTHFCFPVPVRYPNRESAAGSLLQFGSTFTCSSR